MAPANVDALYAQIRKRMVEGGEWEQIQAALAAKLNESGWVDDLRDRSKERARNMDPLSFQTLLEQVNPNAQTSVPLAVKREIISLIRQYLEKQFE
ncbi:transcription factor e(y)2-domain-containing protein [Crucibulum laeve]|uniref:Transcription and mRNA export factor SUS1 n=1 Tax=Crucibulum laeve TaxID=68775 RepID=A0A5C3LUT9_9AGAR|nr:transcription factor e(y)2-domain-containing protein [Crucibulum laeve]